VFGDRVNTRKQAVEAIDVELVNKQLATFAMENDSRTSTRASARSRVREPDRAASLELGG
jgi:hypothetical protein